MTESGGLDSALRSLQWRIESIGMAWNVFLDKPLTGLGPLQSSTAWGNPKYMLSGVSEWSTFVETDSAGSASTHNAFLAIMAEQGIFGIATFVALWLLALKSLRQAYRAPRLRRYALLLGTILAGQFAFVMINPLPRDPWLILAASIALGRLAVSDGNIQQPEKAGG